MRPTVAAVATSAVLLLAFFRAPLVPVAIGAGLACAWSWWRARPGLARGRR
ncbi:MAG TPA: hypothetical protein VKW76_01210 [Candidatus Binatia bacterium]|nr:hypothetical protein [Candidatus Binatia bacterium]